MARTRFAFAAEPWRSFISLLLVILLTGFSIPSPAMAAPPMRPSTAGTSSGNTALALASLRMSLYQFQTKVSLATKTALSALNPPSEFDKLKAQFEEPLIATGSTSAREDKALLQALRSYRDRAVEDDFTPLNVFLSDYPRSAWRVAVSANLGLLDYHYGYFSRAINAWTEAWQGGRTVTAPRGRALVDRAVAELARMHARLGHADALEVLFKEMGDRKVTGSATEILTGAHDGLWMMRHDPGVSYLCGPMALKNLLIAQGSTPKDVQFIEDYRSGPHGVTFEQVAELAAKAGFRSQLVRRSPGEPVPMPSIVHWKVNHFAAILGYANGRYHVQDPTFGTDLWITPRALDAEASGYFLVSQKAKVDTWKPVTANTAQAVFGMGYTNQQKPGTANCSAEEGANCTNGCNCDSGMTGYSVNKMDVSLSLGDNPVGYAPPIGPSAKVQLNYNQREDSQPSTFAWFNVSPKWTLNFLTYVQDDPHSPGSSVSRYAAGGGSYAYYGYSTTTKAFTSETSTGAILVQTSASPITYTRTFPDGHQEIYSQSNGATSYPRIVFISKMIDPAGNALTFNYDSQLRLTSFTDATGRDTTFSYQAANPLLVTSITDPFGRSAQLSYDSSGRLSQIQDVLGLKSQFTYNASSIISALTTPYGTTTFAYSDSSVNPTGDVTRYLNVTDPLGHTERTEYNVNEGSYSDPANTVPTGMNTYDAYLYYRDTYYWDKHAYAVAPGNYSMAQVTHWCHWSQNTNYTSDFVESSKSALENRIWLNYPGQGASYLSGTYNKPTAMGRVLDDGTTQLSQVAYNPQGNVTEMIDPIGRQTQFTYAANGIDLLTTQQKTSASGYSTLAQFTYNTQHLPLTYTDAAGQMTTFAYNSAGQLTQMTDPLGETTGYQYDGSGNLIGITNANGQTQASFTYNQYNDVATTTDSEGYTVSCAYDTLDRVTQETFPDTTTRTYAYTNLDLTAVTDRQGNATQYGYDAVRNLISTTDPLQHVTRLGYWENKSLKNLTDPNGNITTWNIDVQDRVTAKQYADGTQVVNTYEGTTSRLKSLTDALLQVKTFTYGKDDTPTNITYSKSVNPTPNVSFAYDPYFRRITSMTDGNGTRNYAYQPVGSLGALQIAKESGPFTNDSIVYAYDQLSRLTGRTVDTNIETFAYDKLSRLITDGTALGIFKLGYLGQTGQITSQQISTGTVGTTWTYQPNINDRRLKAINNSGATRSFNFTTTPENLITQTQENAPLGTAWAPNTWNYNYDNAYRLTQASSNSGTYSYGLDPVDNVTSFQSPSANTNTTYNNLNQIVNYRSYAYLYDKNGNVLDDGLRTYTWDAENRLLSITSKANASLKTTFAYDGLGRRTAINTGANAETQTRYLWCGEQMCQARTSADVVERRYYSEGEYLPLGGTSLYYSQDQLGSVRDVLATQNGSRVAEFDYDPYGNPSQSNGRVSTDFRYAELFYDQQDGLYLTHHRPYDPVVGRWLNRDPSGENSGVNLYAYVHANPTNGVDPVGLDIRLYSTEGGLHAAIAIDTGTPCNPQVVTFGFGPRFLWTVPVPPFYSLGEIDEGSGGQGYGRIAGGSVVEAKALSLSEGNILVAQLRQLAMNPPLYNLVSFNCWIFASIVFDVVY
jgi:RHS repeat-associated protein